MLTLLRGQLYPFLRWESRFWEVTWFVSIRWLDQSLYWSTARPVLIPWAHDLLEGPFCPLCLWREWGLLCICTRGCGGSQDTGLFIFKVPRWKANTSGEKCTLYFYCDSQFFACCSNEIHSFVAFVNTTFYSLLQWSCLFPIMSFFFSGLFLEKLLQFYFQLLGIIRSSSLVAHWNGWGLSFAALT